MNLSWPPQSGQRLRLGFITAVTVSFALLTAGWLVQYRNDRIDISTQQLVLHSEEVLERGRDLRSRLSEAGTEMRGFLLTSDTEFRGGLKPVLMGSTAERAVRHAPCPVLVVRQTIGS